MPSEGWYQDPEGGDGLRWWDGQQWTDRRQAAGDGPPQVPTPPPTPPASQAATTALQTDPPPVPPVGSPPAPSAQPESPKRSGFAVAALLLGLVPCLVINPILAIVFGFVGRKQIKDSAGGRTGAGMALAGIILGFVWIVLAGVFVALAVAGVFDEDLEVSKTEFVDKYTPVIEQELNIDNAPADVQDDASAAAREFAGCVYDVYAQEPAMVNAKFENLENSVTKVEGVSQSRIDEVVAERERECDAVLDEKIRALQE